MKKVPMEEIVASIEEMPAWPAALRNIIRLTEDPNSDIKDLEKEILKDQSLTTRVLKLSNSLHYGYPSKISTVSQAVVLLGFNTIKNIVLASTVNTMYIRDLDAYGLKKEDLWRQSQSGAIIARHIAKKIKFKKVEEAYVAGLLRDIGKVILDYYMKEEYREILEKIEQEEISFLQGEEAVLGFNHAEIGFKIARKWNLPENLAEAIAYHHRPEEAGQAKELVSLIHIADAITMMMIQNVGVEGLNYRFDPTALKVLDISAEELEEMIVELSDLLLKEEEGF